MLRFTREFTLVAGAALVLSTVCYGQEFVYRLDPEPGVTYQGSTTMETSMQSQIQGMDVDVSTTMRMDHDVVFEAGTDDTVVGRYTTTSVSGGIAESCGSTS